MGIKSFLQRWPVLGGASLAVALAFGSVAWADQPAPAPAAAKPTPAKDGDAPAPPPAPAAKAAPANTAAPASAATPAPATAAPRTLPPIPAGFGRIAGRVTVAGLAPKLAPVPVGKDMKICGTSKADEALEIGPGGGVKNALLWDPQGPAPAKGARSRAKVALSACQFAPHVSATAVPGEVIVTNEDGLFHNVTATGDQAFSYAMPIKGHTIPTKLKKPGVLKLESKNHPWMKGYVHALPTTAFVVTEADGTFYLDLAPGTHTLQLWHERLGERKDQVDVALGETTLHDLSLSLR